MQPIGEIVEASTRTFKAVAPSEGEAPPFGSFVRTEAGRRVTFAVVGHVAHASLDPSRRAIPLGRTYDELAREQPQVLQLLITEFDGACVGFMTDDRIEPYLPPTPPRVHDFVYACTPEQVIELTDDLGFIRTIAAGVSYAPEELVAASIRSAADAHADRRSFLLRAGREVADLYRQDYDQARAILRRLGMRVAGDGYRKPGSPSDRVYEPDAPAESRA